MNTQTPSGSHPYTIVSAGLRRAKVNSLCRQRVVIALDGSGSMGENNKARDASEATSGLCQELALPINKDGFEVAVLHFSTQAKVVHPFESASLLIGHLQPLRVGLLAGDTNITAALELVRELLEATPIPPVTTAIRYVRPLAVLMSDGMHNCGSSPIPAAQALKAMADVLAVGFGDDADEEMLQAIATAQLSVRCRTGADLRCYFAEIGRTLTVTRAAGINATSALARPQQ
jgi:Mg-chelatase subunit ChlD